MTDNVADELTEKHRLIVKSIPFFDTEEVKFYKNRGKVYKRPFLKPRIRDCEKEDI